MADDGRTAVGESLDDFSHTLRNSRSDFGPGNHARANLQFHTFNWRCTAAVGAKPCTHRLSQSNQTDCQEEPLFRRRKSAAVAIFWRVAGGFCSRALHAENSHDAQQPCCRHCLSVPHYECIALETPPPKMLKLCCTQRATRASCAYGWTRIRTPNH